jgi:magnesium chelatase family protein
LDEDESFHGSCYIAIEIGDDELVRLDATGQSLMRSAMQQLQLSARAFHRVLKIARTIADLAGSDEIAPAHLAEAIQCQPRRQG